MEWLRADGPDGDVVLSSRARLARNLAGTVFAHKASRGERQRVLDVCREAILGSGLASRVAWLDMQQCTPADRALLVERHLVSKQLARGRGGPSGSDPRAAALSLPGERLCVMVNEEDHLRVQVIRAGMSLGEALDGALEVDDRLQATLSFAYSPRFGFLTACPTNVGTGLRMSVMLHLPALRITGEIEKFKRAASDMNLAVRGFYGEGSEAVGDLYQVSNQTTLGKTESMIHRDLQDEIIPRFIAYERHSRAMLAGKRAVMLADTVFRSLGLLRHARLLNTDEAMQHLSHVRLGVITGLVRGPDLARVNALLLLIQPTHLQRSLGHDLDQDQRRRARATLLRARLKDAGGDDPGESLNPGDQNGGAGPGTSAGGG